MNKTIICTLCPNGCSMEVTYVDKTNFSIFGNKCDKGVSYAEDECFDPKRTFTGNVSIAGTSRKRMPVRSTEPVPRDNMLMCAEILKKIELEAPIEAGYTVIENIMDTGVDIVTTMSLRKE